jgi:hypothetical protein
MIATWVISLLAILLAPILLIRFRKRWVAAFNLAVTNRITSRFANRLPGFGILTHVGRKSGRVYRTPVNVFRVPDGFLIALTYGRDSEWVQNVLAAGNCQLETPLGDDSRFSCARSSGSLARTISCSFQLPSRVAVSTSQRCSRTKGSFPKSHS